MYFRKISIHGFKSFADPITIEFDRGITCVVGPNGSGKSNIFDALRWVLGEQSPKTLRGGKMDEVIFAGTASRKSRGMAEVSLLIDNSDGSLPVDFSEVEITRRMYRSGESEYYINRSRCRLRDIRELVMDTGIGVDGYSFIGQGKISEIVSGRPESRREIFEEAAGIVRYQGQKAETEKKLTVTGHNLDRIGDLIADLEVRIPPLRKEARRAERYLQLRRQYAEAETAVILNTITHTEAAKEALSEQIADTERQIAAARQDRKAAAAKIAGLTARAEELERRDLEERDRMIQFSGRLSELKNTKKYLSERIDSLKIQLHNLGSEQAALTARLEEEHQSERTVRQKAEELQKSLEKIQRLLQEQNQNFIADSRKLKDSERQTEEGRNQLYEMGIEVSSAAAELDGMKHLHQSLTERLQELKKYDKDSSEERDSVVLQAEKRQVEETEKLLHQLKEETEKIRKELQHQTAQQTELSAELQAIVMNLSRKQAERNALLHMEHNYEGYSGAVRFIMNEPGLDGIFGTVGRLIEVPAGYEIAVETALGARMQNIVCRDDESAARAVQLLKQKKAGRLTFLPLQSLRVSPWRYERELFQERGFLTAASDCVTVLPEYTKAVEYLLSGVIIVDHLKSASRIAAKYRGCRCVTLDGELVSPGGAITGGSYRKNTGGILDRKNRLTEIEETIERQEEEKKQREIFGESLGKEILQSENRLKDFETEEARLKIQLLRQKDEIKAREHFRDEKQRRKQRAQQEMQRLEEQVNASDQQIKKLAEREIRLKKEMDIFRETVERCLSENEKLRKKLENSGNEITQIRLNAEALRGEFSGAKNSMERITGEIRRINDQIASKEERAESVYSEILQQQKELSQTEEAIVTMESSGQSHSGRLHEIQKAKSENIRQTAEQNQIYQQKERIIYELETGRREMNLRRDSSDERIGRLKDRLWEEFELSYIEAAETFPLPSDFRIQEAEQRSKNLKRQLRELGEVNVSAAAEYEAVGKRYDFLKEQREDLQNAQESLRQIIQETDQRIRREFQRTLEQIQIHFKDVFSQLFGGGTAQLSVEGKDLLEAEIDIIAQPPGKKLQNMNLLSGGEKTMTAIALMFAVLKANPAPFCILDEVEAALDEANIQRFSAYLKNFSDVQFVLVTHQKVTMEHADALYGVTMPEKGISKVLSLKLADVKQISEKSGRK